MYTYRFRCWGLLLWFSSHLKAYIFSALTNLSYILCVKYTCPQILVMSLIYFYHLWIKVILAMACISIPVPVTTPAVPTPAITTPAVTAPALPTTTEPGRVLK